METEALKAEFVGHVFDEIDFEIETDSLVDFALACGETQPRFVDPSDADFQAVPNYLTRVHGRRSVPKGFQFEMHRSFDAGKSVEVHGPVRPGDRITARSEIADVYEKTGRSGKMVFVVHRMRFFNQDEAHVATVDWRMVQREFD